MDDEKEKVVQHVSLQAYLEDCGIQDHNTACAAALIMENIRGEYPTDELVTAEPFSSAVTYLEAAGLVTGKPLHLTDLGLDVYKSKPPTVHFVQ